VIHDIAWWHKFSAPTGYVGGASVAHVCPQTWHSHRAGSEGVPLPPFHRTCPPAAGSPPWASHFGQSGMTFMVPPGGRRPLTGLGYKRVSFHRLARLLGIRATSARWRGNPGAARLRADSPQESDRQGRPRWEPTWEPSARTTSCARRTGPHRRTAIMPACGPVRTMLNA
jgi:hypothetical protein